MTDITYINAYTYSSKGQTRLLGKIERELNAKHFTVVCHDALGIAACMAGRNVYDFMRKSNNINAERIAEEVSEDAVYCSKLVRLAPGKVAVFVR